MQGNKLQKDMNAGLSVLDFFDKSQNECNKLSIILQKNHENITLLLAYYT